MPQAAVVGMGIVGRVIACKLLSLGWQVSVFDQESFHNQSQCSMAAGGLLSPLSELAQSPRLIAELGFASLELWPRILSRLRQPVYFKMQGNLFVAHHKDQGELAHFLAKVSTKGFTNFLQPLDSHTLKRIAPDLSSRYTSAYFSQTEGHLDPRDVLTALGKHLVAQGVSCYFGSPVEDLRPHTLQWQGQSYDFDLVIDCRGLAARTTLSHLRGVRGELILIRCPELNLSCPIHLYHHRYPVYIVPRAHGLYAIGATNLEIQDTSPIKVKSALLLLTSAYNLLPAISEASIVECVSRLRPAFTDNLPAIYYRPGLIHCNGLYRFGFLLAPKLAEIIGQFLREGQAGPLMQPLTS